MNNAWTIAWQKSCNGLPQLPNLPLSRSLVRQLNTLSSKTSLKRSLSSIRRFNESSASCPSAHGPIFNVSICKYLIPYISRSYFATVSNPPQKTPPTSQTNNDTTTQFRLPALSKSQIYTIFGARPGQIFPQVAIQALQILQNRRLTGTLDLDLPKDIQSRLSRQQIESGLYWLRKNYVIDEDAAIIARIEREDLAEEENLAKQTSNIHGEGVFERVRKANEARLEKDEAEKKKREEEEAAGLVQPDGPKGLAAWTKPRVIESMRRDEALATMSKQERAEYIRKEKWGKYQAESLQEPVDMSRTRRILPSFFFTVLVLAISYYVATTYEAPLQSNRLFPNTPPAAATLLTIIAFNACIFSLWIAFPPAVNVLNKYFIAIPGAPYALSLLGNVFSHQSLSHIAVNMLFLWIVGTRLHDDIGRGAFLAIFISSGVLGSFASLSLLVLRNNLATTSLGASGAVSGVLACFLAIHANQNLVLWWVPDKWQDWTTFKGQTWFLVCLGMELATFFGRGILRTKVDHYAHLGGYLGGWIGGKVLSEKGMTRRENPRMIRLSRFEPREGTG